MVVFQLLAFAAIASAGPVHGFNNPSNPASVHRAWQNNIECSPLDTHAVKRNVAGIKTEESSLQTRTANETSIPDIIKTFADIGNGVSRFTRVLIDIVNGTYPDPISANVDAIIAEAAIYSHLKTSIATVNASNIQNATGDDHQDVLLSLFSLQTWFEHECTDLKEYDKQLVEFRAHPDLIVTYKLQRELVVQLWFAWIARTASLQDGWYGTWHYFEDIRSGLDDGIHFFEGNLTTKER